METRPNVSILTTATRFHTQLHFEGRNMKPLNMKLQRNPECLFGLAKSRIAFGIDASVS
jgi:hypothetical protein